MEGVGSAAYVADQLLKTEPTVSGEPQRYEHPQAILSLGDTIDDSPIRYGRRDPKPKPVNPYSNSAHVTQYSLPIESQFTGIRFREKTLDPKSLGLATPLDEITGLPLPIVVLDRAPKGANTKLVDYHHHYHPRRDLTDIDDALLALRRSRGQYLPRWLHEHTHAFFAGPEFPTTRQETFRAVVLACAGVIPRKAIDFSDLNGPRIVEVWDNARSQKIFNSVKHEGEKRTATSSIYRSQIGIFFANYAIEQSFQDVVSDKVIDQFLNTKDPHRRKVLGNLMLREAIELAVAPIIPVHQSLKSEGITRKKKTALPELVKDYFVRSRQPEYYCAMDNKLRVA